jgi:hypothetical protein
MCPSDVPIGCAEFSAHPHCDKPPPRRRAATPPAHDVLQRAARDAHDAAVRAVMGVRGDGDIVTVMH